MNTEEMEFDWIDSVEEDVREALRVLGNGDVSGTAAMLTTILEQIPKAQEQMRELRDTARELSTYIITYKVGRDA